MVDREKRSTIKKLGIAGGFLLGGGGGVALYGEDAAQRFEAWQEERAERRRKRQEAEEQKKEAEERRKEKEEELRKKREAREHRRRQRETAERWAGDVEERLKSDMDDRYNWGDSEIAVDGIEVTYEKTGETGEAGFIYDFTVTGPLRDDSPITLCDYAGTEQDERYLAGLLERAAIEFHTYLYGLLDGAIPPHQAADEPRIVSFTTAFEDETGRAEATLDWETAERVAQGNDFQPDYWDERQAYTQEYRLAFNVECDA